MKKSQTPGYEDIIGLPHPASKTRSRMALTSRAAQFAPFAALTGYEDAISETARLTDERVEPGESAECALNDRLNLIIKRLKDRPEVSLTYFKPDPVKHGGMYVRLSGAVRKLDDDAKVMVMTSGDKIPIDDIIALDGTIFDRYSQGHG